MLVRSGIGKMTVIDADNVAESNINRQLIALRSNVGRSKAIMYAERFHDINPEAVIDALGCMSEKMRWTKSSMVISTMSSTASTP